MRIPTFNQFQMQADQLAQQYDQMNRLLLQSVSGHRIESSSEDPVLASQIKFTENVIGGLQSYYNNGVLSSQRMQSIFATMQGALDMINDVQLQLSKIQGGTLNSSQKELVSNQLTGDLTRLLTLANTQDANGNYIFSGFSTNLQPYTQVAGSYQYQGGMTPATIDIGPNATTLFYENGFSVFGDIFTGNGTFTISAASTNTGKTTATPGTVTDPSAYVPDTYTLTIVTNSAGHKAYQVVGASSGQVIPASGSIPANAPDYIPGMDVSFKGLTFHMDGDAEVGDVFTIQPSTQENVFNTIQDLISTLNTPAPNKALFDQKISQISASITQIIQHLVGYQSHIGVEAGRIDGQVKNNNDQILSYETSLTGIRDIDMISVNSQLAQKSLAIQATQQSYAQIQQLLLNLIKI